MQIPPWSTSHLCAQGFPSKHPYTQTNITTHNSKQSFQVFTCTCRTFILICLFTALLLVNINVVKISYICSLLATCTHSCYEVALSSTEKVHFYLFFMSDFVSTESAVTHCSILEEIEEGSVLGSLSMDLSLDVNSLKNVLNNWTVSQTGSTST